MYRAPVLTALSLVLLGSALGLGACGNDGESAPGAASEAGAPGSSGGTAPGTQLQPIPADQFAEALYDALCDGLAACCHNAGFDYVEGACRETLRRTGGANAPLVGQLGTPDTVYDAQAAAACVELVRGMNRACGVPSMADPLEQSFAVAKLVSDPALRDCGRVLTGTKQPGEACLPGQCALPGNAYLAVCGPLDEASEGPNVCQIARLVGEGEACDDPGAMRRSETRVCADADARLPTTLAEYEAVVDAGLLCDQGTCVKAATLLAREGEPCGEERNCARGLACHRLRGVCEPDAPVGASCEELGCVQGASCTNTPQTCEADRADGTSCATQEACLGRCNAKKICASRHDGAASPSLCQGQQDGG